MNFEFTGREQINNSYNTGSKSPMDIVILTVGIGTPLILKIELSHLSEGHWSLNKQFETHYLDSNNMD